MSHTRYKDAPLLDGVTVFANAHYAEVGGGCEQFFNQILANVYIRQRDEYIPWHSDEDPLYCPVVTASCMLKPLALMFPKEIHPDTLD